MMQSAMSRAAATVFQQVLRHERVHGRDAGDVDDRNRRAGLDDALQQAFHDHLCACAVEGTDEREREDAVPQLDHRRGEFQHLLLLAVDDLFAAFLEDLHRVETELVQQLGNRPRRIERRGIVRKLAANARKERLLQREHERGRLRRAEAEPRARS